MRRRLLPLLSALVLVLAAACGADDPGDDAASPTAVAGSEAPTEPGEGGVLEPSPPFGLERLALVSPEDERVELDVYTATTSEERSRGLMFRESLPEQAGMDFRYEDDSAGAFWMKNTLIPLSIAFYDADGVILTILDMEPCEEDPCPTYDPGTAYRGALEVNQGAFDEWGVEPGWRVEPAG